MFCTAFALRCPERITNPLHFLDCFQANDARVAWWETATALGGEDTYAALVVTPDRRLSADDIRRALSVYSANTGSCNGMARIPGMPTTVSWETGPYGEIATFNINDAAMEHDDTELSAHDMAREYVETADAMCEWQKELLADNQSLPCVYSRYERYELDPTSSSDEECLECTECLTPDWLRCNHDQPFRADNAIEIWTE